ncbi:hypothetical protein ACLKA7_014404 [Drosophila subpalustris]
MLDHNEGAQLLTDQFIEDKALLNVAACSKNCLESRQAENLLGCVNYCKETDSSMELTRKSIHKVQDNFFLSLVCRTESNLSFRINWVQHSRESIGNASVSVASNAMFIIKINQKHNSLSSLIYLSDDSFFTIAELEDNTEYVISAFAMHANGAYSHIVIDENFKTLRRGYQPSKMGEVKLRKFHSQPEDYRRISAEIEWLPSAERNCYFHMIYYSLNSRNLEQPTPVDFLDPSKLYTYTIPNMEIGDQFMVGVRTINIKNRLESPVQWLTLQTPNCLDWFNYNYTLCAPLRPSNLSVSQQHLKLNQLSLNVTWSLPKYLPDNYTLQILDLHEDYEPAKFNVDRSASYYYISNVTILGDSFEVHLTAQTQGGKNVTVQMLTKIPQESWLKVRTLINLIIIFLFVPICCVVALFSLKFRGHKSQHLEAMDMKAAPSQAPEFHLTLAHNNSLLATLAVEDNFELDDELEVEPHQVLLQDVLGEGAFGLVRRGVYKQRQVAVKLLKDQPNEEDVEAFRCEIQMLKGVGRHPNIVGIVGYSTRFSNRMMLLTEYCGLGSLQSFLRDEWKFRQERSALEMRLKLSQGSEKQRTQNLIECDTRIEDINRSMLSTVEEETDGDLSRNSLKATDTYRLNTVILAADNKSYGLQDIENIDANQTPPPLVACLKAMLKRTVDEPKPAKNCAVSFENQEYFQPIEVTAPREPLKYADLLDIAQQVAVGMDFLAQNKIVHRDLAARNVLISLDRTIKIADFGLSRDVYHENVYRKSGGSGKLPIKWLALESLTHQVYTSQSDVWSFGVLLYEIITLGGMPYPSISPRDLLQLLRQGQRMKRPEGCTDELFKLMERCWCSIPANRPTFSDLIKRLDAMLLATKDIPRRILQQLNAQEHSKVDQLSAHDQHYLQPLD